MVSFFVAALVSVGVLCAQNPIGVTLCNPAKLPPSVVNRLMLKIREAFESVGTPVAWHDCGKQPLDVEHERCFVVRLRKCQSSRRNDASSRFAMGQSFLADAGGGYLADAYFDPVQEFAASYRADPVQLLAYVVMHELGHLLLGPAHSHTGVMRAGWDLTDLTAIQQRSFKFDSQQRTRIRERLRRQSSSEQSVASASPSVGVE